MFGVAAPDAVHESTALVRLRAYAEGNVRDYRGERYSRPPPPGAPPLSVTPLPAGNGRPRLVSAGIDATPATEPEPSLAVDRLLKVAIAPGVRNTVSVLLHGACVGTMADLATKKTCIDTAETLVAAVVPPTDLQTSDGGNVARGRVLWSRHPVHRDASLREPCPRRHPAAR